MTGDMQSCGQQSDSTTLMSIPAEIRLDIYKHSFATPTKITLRRRDEIHDEQLSKKLSTSLIPSLLATCHQIHHEALPIFYGSHSFYIAMPHSMFTGKEANKQSSVYGDCLPYARNHINLIAHLSLGWDIQALVLSGSEHVDPILAAGINFFVEECSELRTVTLNFLPNNYSTVLSWRLQRDSATAKVLHTLRNRLDELTIIMPGPHVALHGLRQGIWEDESAWKHEIDLNGPWPGMSLKREHQNTLVEIQRGSRPINKYTLPWKTC